MRHNSPSKYTKYSFGSVICLGKKSLTNSSAIYFFKPAWGFSLIKMRVDGEEFWLKLKFENVEILAYFKFSKLQS